MTQAMRVLGSDLTKRVYRDERGKIVLRKRLSRHPLRPFIATLSPLLSGMALSEQLAVNIRLATTEAFSRSENNRRTWGTWSRWWRLRAHQGGLRRCLLRLRGVWAWRAAAHRRGRTMR